MIRRERHQRLVADPEAYQRRLEAADELIRPGHFAVVGPVREPRCIRLGRFVRGVRIVEVDPHERPRSSVALEPRNCVTRRGIAAFFEDVEKARFVGRIRAEVELIGKMVEAAGQA